MARWLPTQGLTVSSGGLLINANNDTIATPALNLNGKEGIFHVNGTGFVVSSVPTTSRGTSSP